MREWICQLEALAKRYSMTSGTIQYNWTLSILGNIFTINVIDCSSLNFGTIWNWSFLCRLDVQWCLCLCEVFITLWLVRRLQYGLEILYIFCYWNFSCYGYCSDILSTLSLFFLVLIFDFFYAYTFQCIWLFCGFFAFCLLFVCLN